MIRAALTLILTLLHTLAYSSAGFAQDIDRKPPQQIVVLRLKYASAEWVAKKLTAEFGRDVTVTFDAPNNTVFIIRADADTIRRAKDRTAQLEECKSTEPGMKCVWLTRASAGDVAVVLKMMLIFQRVMGDERSVSVFACEKANVVLLNGSKQKTDRLVEIIRALDAQRK